MSNPHGDEVSPPSSTAAGGPWDSPELRPITAPVPYESPVRYESPAPNGSAAPNGAQSEVEVEVEPEPTGQGRRAAVAGTLTALVVAVAGLGLGVLWLQLAPRLGIIKVAGGFLYADAEPEQAVAADGVFGFIGVGAGVMVALLAWVLLRRYRGVSVLIGLVVGSLVCAWLAWWLGARLGMAQFEAVRDTAPIGTRVEAPLALRLTDLDRNAYWPPQVTGVVAVQALVAAMTYTILAGFSIHPGLRPPRVRQDHSVQVSSVPAVPADQTS